MAAHYARFTDAAVRALNSLDSLPKIVTISSSTFVGDAAPNAGKVYDGLHAMERALDATVAPTCHLRNAFFMDNLLQGLSLLKSQNILSFPIPADRELAMITSADIARVAGQEMQRASNEQTHRVLYAGRYTMSHAAELIARGAGRAIRYQQADPEITRAQLLGHGASPDFVETYLAMSQAPVVGEENAAADENAMTLQEFVNRQIIPKLG